MSNYDCIVSIGITVYNVEKYVRKCVLSALNQNFNEEYEILVIDDKGSDSSIDIVKDLQTDRSLKNHE